MRGGSVRSHPFHEVRGHPFIEKVRPSSGRNSKSNPWALADLYNVREFRLRRLAPGHSLAPSAQRLGAGSGLAATEGEAWHPRAFLTSIR